MSEEKSTKLNNYFDGCIDRMIIKDIELLKERNSELKFSYPYILLVCSGIDFFGGIECGFKRDNSSKRFKWFVNEWMGKINDLYKEESLATLIYDRWRCGVAHQATLKRGFEASSYMYRRDRHLYYIENPDNESIFIHPLQFADDFIKAQKLYRENINNRVSDFKYTESLHNNLLNMTKEHKDDKKFKHFIKILKDKNMVFKPSYRDSTSTSVSQSSSNDTITRLVDAD